jgi:hypothetical protein
MNNILIIIVVILLLVFIFIFMNKPPVNTTTTTITVSKPYGRITQAYYMPRESGIDSSGSLVTSQEIKDGNI